MVVKTIISYHLCFQETLVLIKISQSCGKEEHSVQKQLVG